MYDDIKNLYKYGKKQHMLSLLTKGEICLNPASRYRDTTLPIGAIDPKELEITQSIDPIKHNAKIMVYDSTGKKLKGTLEPKGVIQETTSLGSDYYIYCLSLRHDVRLFDDFAADSYVHIRNPEVFIERMYKALDYLLPDWANIAKRVFYLDETQYLFDKPDVCFCKRIKYRHQKEFRFSCLPSSKQNSLSPIFVNIGGIDDIADIYPIN